MKESSLLGMELRKGIIREKVQMRQPGIFFYIFIITGRDSSRPSRRISPWMLSVDLPPHFGIFTVGFHHYSFPKSMCLTPLILRESRELGYVQSYPRLHTPCSKLQVRFSIQPSTSGLTLPFDDFSTVTQLSQVWQTLLFVR